MSARVKGSSNLSKTMGASSLNAPDSCAFEGTRVEQVTAEAPMEAPCDVVAKSPTRSLDSLDGLVVDSRSLDGSLSEFMNLLDEI